MEKEKPVELALCKQSKKIIMSEKNFFERTFHLHFFLLSFSFRPTNIYLSSD